MYAQVEKPKENKSRAVANSVAQKKPGEKQGFGFVDNRPEAVAQRKLHELAKNSPQVKQTAQLQAMAVDSSAQQRHPIQKVESNTGLPDNLKSGIENLSGYSMDDVKVHYNSNKPAQLQAHAYAQGTDIHLASGQEKHLPHEAWHVVQQKQGRVKPTVQMKGRVNVNDDVGLEKEADTMGAKANNASTSRERHAIQKKISTCRINSPIQRRVGLEIETKIPVFNCTDLFRLDNYLATKYQKEKTDLLNNDYTLDDLHDEVFPGGRELTETEFKSYITDSQNFLKTESAKYYAEIKLLQEADVLDPFEIQEVKDKLVGKVDLIMRANAALAAWQTTTWAAIKADSPVSYGKIYDGTKIEIHSDKNPYAFGVIKSGAAAAASILEFVTKPLKDNAEIDSAFVELNGVLGEISTATSDMKKRGVLSKIGKYVGPLRQMEDSLYDLNNLSGAVQINMGIDPRAFSDAVQDIFVDRSMTTKGHTKFDVAMTKAKASAIKITKELFIDNATITNKTEAQGFKGIENLILMMLMYVECGLENTSKSTIKNAVPLLPKTGLKKIKEISFTPKENTEWKTDVVWLKILTETKTKDTDTLIKGDTNSGYQVQHVKLNLGEDAPIIVGKSVDADNVGPDRDASDKVPHEDSKRQGGVFELRTVQDQAIPRTSWKDVAKEFLAKSEEWNRKK